MRESLAWRVAERLRELSEQRGFRLSLAKRLKKTPPAITPYVSGERAVTLEMLEAISEIAHIPLAELVALPGSDVKELNPNEAALIRALRQWPSSVTKALLTFVAFFADEEPAATQTRNLHAYFREFDQKDRDWYYGIAVLMHEGMLPPDVREGLMDRLAVERYKRQADAATKRPKRAETT